MLLNLRSPLRLVLVLVLAFAAMGRAVAAEPSVTLGVDALAMMGIKCENLSLGGISQDGTQFVCWERESDPKTIAQGKVVRLAVFRVDWKTQKASTPQFIWLPCTFLDQMTISPDGRWALCVTQKGMRLVAVDLQKGTAHVVAGFEKGKPGFRVQPYVAWAENGRFMAVGYFYDEAGNVKTEALVSVDPEGTSLEAVKQVRDLTKLNKQTKNCKVGAWLSSGMAYFAGYRNKVLHLYAWAGSNLVEIDKAAGSYLVMPGKDRILYIADRKGTPEIVVQDFPSLHKTTVAAQPGKPLSYPLMSVDGSTILLSHVDGNGRRISTFFGRDENRWRLQPVPALQGATPGTLRLSPGGTAVAQLSRKGMILVQLPPK